MNLSLGVKKLLVKALKTKDALCLNYKHCPHLTTVQKLLHFLPRHLCIVHLLPQHLHIVHLRLQTSLPQPSETTLRRFSRPARCFLLGQSFLYAITGLEHGSWHIHQSITPKFRSALFFGLPGESLLSSTSQTTLSQREDFVSRRDKAREYNMRYQFILFGRSSTTRQYPKLCL